MNEQQLEQLCLGWFSANGWDILYGPNIACDGIQPLRDDYQQVTLEPVLKKVFTTINPHLPEECFEQILVSLAKHTSLDLTTNNNEFHKLLINGVAVKYKKDDKIITDHALLIDFDHLNNNSFIVVNQYTLVGKKQNRRLDLICFINGLPLAILELKSPTNDTANIWQAFNQLQTYKDDIPELFIFNEALVISDGYSARAGSLTADKERFMPWHTIKNEKDKPKLEWQLEVLIKGFFNRELFLEYIHFFILFETINGKLIKKLAGYHQFHAVKEAVQATIIASGNDSERHPLSHKIQQGSKKAGVVWHTQGSGKSFSMCCYAGMLLQQPAMKNPTIIIVTDRNDLDSQLFSTFSSASDLLKQTPIRANSREELRQLLAQREAGGIIFTTIQKFALLNEEMEHPLLNDRHNIVVISDEAHRSQYGFEGSLTSNGYQFGYAQYLRDALKNATFIGFTGTPISLEDKDTRSVFGDYISIYDIQDAVDDGATVPIYYESRLAKLNLNYSEINELSAQVENIVEDEEDLVTREKIKSKWTRLEIMVGAQERLKLIATDIVEHFEARTKILDGKAIVVAMSREICVHLYNEIVKLRPEWHDPDPEKGIIKVVMTGSASDTPLLQPHIYNANTKRRLAMRFTDYTDPLKLVIVRDMWLTGFDAPCCHTMYIDKPMKGHNLMQAIARVNRVFRDKTAGLVVDYIGIANELKRALKVYTESNGRGEPTLRAEEAFIILKEKIDAIRCLFSKTPSSAGFDIKDFEHSGINLLIPATNYILGLQNGKKRFLDLILAATKAFSLCGTLDEAKTLNKELAFYSAIKTAINKTAAVDKKRTEEEKNSLLKQIVDNAIVAEGVEDIFALCGLEKPNIGLLSDEFLEDVRQMPYQNLAVELLEKLIKDSIKSKSYNNVVQEKRFADRLEETLRKYNNLSIETAQVIEELIQMAKDYQKQMDREQTLGLNPDEVAFYDALANNESAVKELGDEVLKKIAIEITDKLRKSTTVDWQVRDSIRARLKILVRRTLQRYKYPPDKEAEAIELVIKQAEVLSNSWTT